ncbi:hypothetical protein B1B04_02830 [Lysinibacillus sp. KCTC 33748]|nr:hypothetical protein B1B04_02830 [Lysinibacillus sp. KCTC 33748]
MNSLQFVPVINIKHYRKKTSKNSFNQFARFFVLLNQITKQFLEDIEEKETIKRLLQVLLFCIQYLM